MTAETRADLASALRNGLGQLELDLDTAQQRLLLRFLGLVEQWNGVYNLTALRDPQTMLSHHLLDSLAVVRPLENAIATRGWPTRTVELLDVGSGAGLPGVVLAIACPELAVTCVDAVGKKAGFVQQAAIELGVRNLNSVHARVEALAPRPWQVIASRAFASLDDFVSLTSPLLAEDGMWMAMKGKTPKEELDLLGADVEVFHVEQLSIPRLEGERCIVWMRKRVLRH
jgi:16S rRNA (guanine527-N7)-methyltransferase